MYSCLLTLLFLLEAPLLVYLKKFFFSFKLNVMRLFYSHYEDASCEVGTKLY